jgi:ribosome-associated toxin RatA of RatAB toxin-antitoxin module
VEMAQAEIDKTLKVNREKLLKAITQYEDYPEFIDNVTGVKVERQNDHEAIAHYHLSVMGKEFHYSLMMKEDRKAGKVKWELQESDFFKKNSGSWTLEAVSESETKAHYELEVEFKISVPGFILNRLVKGNLPKMLESFEKRAK